MFSLPVSQFADSINVVTITQFGEITSTLSKIGIYSALFIIFAGSVVLIRRFILKNRPESIISTWGCGYVGSTKKMQYTASSFIRTYRKLFEPFLQIIKIKKETRGLFPSKVHQETHPGDKIEFWLIYKPIHSLRQLLSRFTFLQNGNVQAYILYGFIFISLIIIIPQIIEKIKFLINFLNQL
jgi:hypothetical protein